MNKWMKLSALLMALIMMLSMVGCGKKEAAATQPPETEAPVDGGETTQTEAQPETTAPAGETEPTAAPENQEQTTNQEQLVTPEASEENASPEFDGELPEEENELGAVGTEPIITVKWETYESMSEAEKTAYQACFSDQETFDMWCEMAMTYAEMEEMDFYDGSLNLKEILSMLIGEDLK